MNDSSDGGTGPAQAKSLYINIILSGILMLGLYLTSLYSYLLFHTVTELFGIAIGFSIFILVWNSRRYMDNSYLLLLGISFLFVACVDLSLVKSLTQQLGGTIRIERGSGTKIVLEFEK